MSCRVDSMARATGLGEGYAERVGLAIRMTAREVRCLKCRLTGAGSERMLQVGYTKGGERALEAQEWLCNRSLCLQGLFRSRLVLY